MSPSRRRAIGAVRGLASRPLARAPASLARPRLPPPRAPSPRAPLLEITRKVRLILHHDGAPGNLENRVDGENIPNRFLNLYQWILFFA